MVNEKLNHKHKEKEKHQEDRNEYGKVVWTENINECNYSSLK